MSSPQNPPQPDLSLYCPQGGTFYICTDPNSPRFLGCCAQDPCSSGCPPEALRPAASFAEYPGRPQSCMAPYDSSKWYTCAQASPKFLGCCRRDPCNEGCADEDLLPARLADDEASAAPFLSVSRAWGSTTEGTSTGVATQRQTMTETAGGEATGGGEGGGAGGGETSEGPGANTGLIVGVTMAGVVVLLVVTGVILWKRRRDDNTRHQRPRSPGDSQPEPEFRVPRRLQLIPPRNPVPSRQASVNSTANRSSSPKPTQDDPASLRFPNQRELGPETSASGSRAAPDPLARQPSQVFNLGAKEWKPWRPKSENLEPAHELEGEMIQIGLSRSR
ncbi:hypothetical protein F5B20DRAFT_588825 [Whalleya microplaca]|nr:hypothetical protein F5B20DRAFT_588825 [Whalleya microplaca]